MKILLRLLLLSAVLLSGCSPIGSDPVNQEAAVIGQPYEVNIDMFSRAEGPRQFAFPRDHGPHPDFQTEWWYYTGNLFSATGERFGYQLTFFRRAIEPANVSPAGSEWRTNQIYFAHFALSSINDNRHFAAERFSRGAAGLAGAQGEPVFEVWLENWSVRQVGSEEYVLQASDGEISVRLNLVNQKGNVLQGEDGYSRKGPEPGNASYYISQTRLVTSGVIRVAENEYPVEGFSWMDHEFSTSALGSNQVGWDWFSLQLDNNTEIMLFTLRNLEGETDDYASGTIIDENGNSRLIGKDDFSILTTATWRSPDSGAEYPTGWVIRIPSEGIEIQVEPAMANQEMRLSFTYWEGAVNILGTMGENRVSGYGYVELTGYAESMQGQF